MASREPAQGSHAGQPKVYAAFYYSRSPSHPLFLNELAERGFAIAAATFLRDQRNNKYGDMKPGGLTYYPSDIVVEYKFGSRDEFVQKWKDLRALSRAKNAKVYAVGIFGHSSPGELDGWSGDRLRKDVEEDIRAGRSTTLRNGQYQNLTEEERIEKEFSDLSLAEKLVRGSDPLVASEIKKLDKRDYIEHSSFLWIAGCRTAVGANQTDDSLAKAFHDSQKVKTYASPYYATFSSSWSHCYGRPDASSSQLYLRSYQGRWNTLESPLAAFPCSVTEEVVYE